MTAHDPAAPVPAGEPSAVPATPLPGAPDSTPDPELQALTAADFDFELPESLIAQHPASERSGSRLLDATGEVAADRLFRDLPALLAPGDLLVFNDTRVIKARLHGRKASGGAVEALVERVLPGPGHEVWAHLRASKAPRPGSLLRFARDDRGPAGPAGPEGSVASASAHQHVGEAFEAEVLGRAGPDGSLYHLRLPADPLALLDRHGHVPLPPYIHHDDGEDDERRYQSVFAARPGAVAAPTASLHFDETVLQALQARGVRRAAVTLHVGAGTFLPMRVQHIAEHRMHSEWFEVGEDTVHAVEQTRQTGGRIVAVGTTTVRSLESAAAQGGLRATRGETTLFITPGYPFRVVDQMITNFHLPRSTLLMLVSAFAGRERVLALYRHAVRERYRFFSYGDAMLLARAGLGAGRSA